jgi:hypothetical protein
LLRTVACIFLEPKSPYSPVEFALWFYIQFDIKFKKLSKLLMLHQGVFRLAATPVSSKSSN